MNNHLVLFIVSILLLVPGFLGIILPFPGQAYMFLIALLFKILDKTGSITLIELLILLFIVLVSLFIDYASGLIGAKYGGASKSAVMVGLIGLIVGFILFPPFGGIAGLFMGVLIFELLSKKDHKKALKAASGSLFGHLSGMVLSLLLSLTFFVLFILFAK